VPVGSYPEHSLTLTPRRVAASLAFASTVGCECWSYASREPNTISATWRYGVMNKCTITCFERNKHQPHKIRAVGVIRVIRVIRVVRVFRVIGLRCPGLRCCGSEGVWSHNSNSRHYWYSPTVSQNRSVYVFFINLPYSYPNNLNTLKTLIILITLVTLITLCSLILTRSQVHDNRPLPPDVRAASQRTDYRGGNTLVGRGGGAHNLTLAKEGCQNYLTTPVICGLTGHPHCKLDLTCGR
jgi:hypothetical protein